MHLYPFDMDPLTEVKQVELGLDPAIVFTCASQTRIQPGITTRVLPCSEVGSNQFTEVQKQVKNWYMDRPANAECKPSIAPVH